MKITFSKSIRKILRPLAKLAISKGFNIKDIQPLLKQAFYDAASKDFKLDGKRLTDSRISIISGLQRREVKQLANEGIPLENRPNPTQRLHSHLLALGKDTITYEDFEALSRSINQDIHPRTFYDEFIRLELLLLKGSELKVSEKSFIDHGSDNDIEIFGDNISAHTRTGVDNLLGETPMLEQAMYATNLTIDDARALQIHSRNLTRNMLIELNKMATQMQRKEKGNQDIRIGIYFSEKGNDK